MAKLLVSVRSEEEGQAAMEGGASIIDVKEPAAGSLGQASIPTIAAVVKRIAGRLPVSAALGELSENFAPTLLRGLNYVKWGLAGSQSGWQQLLLDAARKQTANSTCFPLAVAYADWQQAYSPSPEEVWAFVRDHAWPIFLLDTWKKDGRTLLDWLSFNEIGRLCDRCHRHGIRLGLAGSLGIDQICTLLPSRPDIFAVRGAVCRRNDRIGVVETRRVRQLVRLLTPERKLRGWSAIPEP